MKAVMIPCPAGSQLRPLTSGTEVRHLQVMGAAIEEHVKNLLRLHRLDPEPGGREGEPEAETLLIEENLLCDVDLTQVLDFHRKAKADMTLVLRRCPLPRERVVVCMKMDGRIEGVREPGDWSGAGQCLETGGICVLGAGVIPAAAEEDCLTLLRQALERKKKVYGIVSERYSRSIVTLEDYMAVHQDVLSGKLQLRMHANQVRSGFWVESGARLEKGALIETPAYISRDCVVERGAKVGAGSFLGQGVTLRTGAAVKRAVIGRGCELEHRAQVRGGVLADHVRLGRNSRVMEESVVGRQCAIEPECVINPGLKVWPQKRIRKGTQLSENLVWGSIGSNRLFAGGGISGEVNVDITPEFMAKIGAAAGTLLPGGKVGISWDSAPVCGMLASALRAGLISSGVRVYRFGEQSLPITRNGVRHYKLGAGIHINEKRIQDTYYPELTFLRAGGTDFTAAEEKALEQVFADNLFRRAEPQNIQAEVPLENYRHSYIQEILSGLRTEHFRRNMELRTRSETVSELLESLLAEIEKHMEQSGGMAEFQADVSENGQSLTLFTSAGLPLSMDQTLAWYAVLLCKYFQVQNVVLPVSASSQIEKLVVSCGGRVSYCGTSNAEFMQAVLQNGTEAQFRLCFDGIFAAVSILDYLNDQDVSFDTFVEKLPLICRREAEFPCGGERMEQVLSALYQKYQHCPVDFTDGLKIYQDQGWVLILPDQYRHYIRIITEGTNMEAAEEISTNFKKQIKRLAYPDEMVYNNPE